MKTFNKAFLIEFFALAVPIMLQSLSGNILNLCDTIMVGKLSEVAISGVTVANKTYFIYCLVIFGASSGVSIFMAQYFGASDEKKYSLTFWFGIKLCVIIAIAFLLILLVIPEAVISLYVKNPKTISTGLSYIKIVRFSYLPAAVNVMAAVYFRINQKQNIPMYIGMISVVCNIFLNYILIYGKMGVPKLEVRGAAYATLGSRILEMCILLLLLYHHKKKAFSDEKLVTLTWHMRFMMIKKILPLIVNEAVWAISLSMVFKNYCNVNENYIPAITVVDNVFDIVNVAFFGCSMSAGILMGKCLGANRLQEAKQLSKNLIKIDLLVSVGASICIFLISAYIPTLFSLTGKTLMMATTLLRIKVFFSWTQGYGETVYYVLRAGGDTRAVFLVDGFFMFCGPFLVSTLVSNLTNWPLPFVYFFTEGTYLLKIFIATYLYRKGRWIKNITELKL